MLNFSAFRQGKQYNSRFFIQYSITETEFSGTIFSEIIAPVHYFITEYSVNLSVVVKLSIYLSVFFKVDFSFSL